MFDELCSVYVDAKDNYGRFVDMETGELIQQMTIREFCLTDRWKPVVDRLRGMIAEQGLAAKKTDAYRNTKKLLPGATLSGLFALGMETDERTGRTFECSRRTTHLQQHTGYLCIDIDQQDNENLGDLSIVLRTLRHRPEVALLMRSCSGTGYFALIPLAYPQYHKEQFRALIREYAALGITLDRQCADVTRIRFASYDDHPYINEAATPYMGVDLGQQMLAPRAAVYRAASPTTYTDDKVETVGRLIDKLEQHHIDITAGYENWMRVGFALSNLPDPYGREYFHRVSRLNPNYKPQETDHKFSQLQSNRIGLGTFFAICRNYGVTLR